MTNNYFRIGIHLLVFFDDRDEEDVARAFLEAQQLQAPTAYHISVWRIPPCGLPDKLSTICPPEMAERDRNVHAIMREVAERAERAKKSNGMRSARRVLG